MEVGPRDMMKNEYVLVDRVNRSHRVTVTRGELEVKVQEMLTQVHDQLFAR